MERLPTYPREAYGPLAERIRYVKRDYPSERGWGTGWPDCQEGKLVGTKDTNGGVVRPSDGRRFNRPVRREMVELFQFLMQTTMDLGYEFRGEDEPDGGVGTFNCRAIKGSNPPKPSWHSWGLAIDINSDGNPQFTFRSTQPPWMVDLWESSGFYWGGRYKPGFEDAMHFEYCFRPADVAKDLANARVAAARIREQLFPHTEPPTVPTPEEPAVTPEQVKALQQALNELGWTPSLVVDGLYGPKTDAAVKGVATAVKTRIDDARGLAQERGDALALIKTTAEATR